MATPGLCINKSTISMMLPISYSLLLSHYKKTKLLRGEAFELWEKQYPLVLMKSKRRSEENTGSYAGPTQQQSKYGYDFN